MRSSIYFLLVGLFFLSMNVLLWRSEFGNKHFAVPVPVQTVVKRLFESADDSNLEIRRRGSKIGYCRWIPSDLSPPLPTGINNSSGALPEGMVAAITGYSIDLDGSLKIEDDTRLRFSFSFQVDTNGSWQEFNARLQVRPWKCDVQARPSQQSIVVKLEDGTQSRQHLFSLADLRDPGPLLRQIGGPLLGDAFAGFDLPGRLLPSDPLSLNLDWEAHLDRRRIGQTPIPVYRLQSTLLDHYRLVVYILESGEILRAELPENIVLVNDDLITFK